MKLASLSIATLVLSGIWFSPAHAEMTASAAMLWTDPVQSFHDAEVTAPNTEGVTLILGASKLFVDNNLADFSNGTRTVIVAPKIETVS